MDQVTLNHLSGDRRGIMWKASSRFKEVRMWEKQQPQQLPEELEGLDATEARATLKGQSYPGGDRQ